MSTDPLSLTRGSRALELIASLLPPVRSRQFWIVQAGVLLVAFLDEVVLDYMGVRLPFGIPAAKITALLLVPVVYAALNFGVRGAVGTALWATALMFPDWLFIARESTANTWVEIGNLVILIVVAFIVGQRVEREGQARLRAEGALRANEVAETPKRAIAGRSNSISSCGTLACSVLQRSAIPGTPRKILSAPAARLRSTERSDPKTLTARFDLLPEIM